MSYLENHKDMLKTIIQIISDALNLDCAVFDTESNLIASTTQYLKRKGSSVHAPSIEEVILNGNILVNKPGYMKSCIGCRFREHCPATIELLNCIKIEELPIGVIALTSFTKTGHDKIAHNIDLYTKILNEITVLISNMIYNKDKTRKTLAMEEMLQCALNICDDSMIIIDSAGSVSYGNDSALKLFSFCSLYTQTVRQIFPEHMNSRIMKGEEIQNEIARITSQYMFVSSMPIIHNGAFIGAAIRISQDRETKYSKKSDHKANKDRCLEDIKGDSFAIRDLKKKVRKIANSSSTVLITGETGTGKGLLAKAIHFESSRANQPFVMVNCTSIPESLFESEVFGYEEGAFTGAKKGGKPGRFELAQKGTIFLDEIGEIPMPMQAKLLKVLQEYTIERVGGISSIPVDIRVIAATNKDLEALIKEKKFREDLYYRLNVIPINLPPLKERKEDVGSLAKEFLKKYNHRLNKKIPGFSQEVMDFFMDYSWPGNIRELENIVEYAVNMAEGTITIEDIPHKYSQLNKEAKESIKSKVENVELEMIKESLDKHGWDVKGKALAAEELGIGLRTLYRKLKNIEKCKMENTD
ncbi:sigma-54 interaction domain-containing protein [Lutispora sp.]|uniref:sigma-54 interaction domain-containing protein n=1 Tax=Lutispora sp. TaxID=2828727 RepID=UPI002B1F61F1|nr:sigma 54-interacting transcriptional regulator [Lutispora sp.]MEA4961204.1 sigma 54-interacting transcriptional regulator [Lutispora sp.]